MTIDELIKISDGGASAEMVGRSFFTSNYTKSEKAEFIKILLAEKKYGFIADVICCGAISKEYNYTDFHNSQIGLVSLDLRYFYMFTEICESGGITLGEIAPLLFAAFSAPVSSRLHGWAPAATQYLQKLAATDFDAVLSVLTEYDKSYKRYGVLYKTDRERTVAVLINRLIFEKNTNKAAIRKFLFETKVNIVPALKEIYAGAISDSRVRESVVRLLLLSKHDGRAAEMLDYVAQNDRSKTIRALLEKDATAQKKVGKGEERIEKTNRKNGRAKRLSGEEKRFFGDMISGKGYTPEEFESFLTDPEAEAVASGLLFSVHTAGGGITDVVIVEKGKIFNLDNDPVEIPKDKTVKVLHVAELPEKYEFLTRLNVTQPFLQLKRKAYVPSPQELSENRSLRLSGTIIISKDLRRNISNEGFKVTGKDPDGKSHYAGISLGGFICLIGFTRTDMSSNDKIITFGDIKFYRYKDAIKIGGGFYFENVPVCKISEVPPRVFSEGIYAVCRLSGTINER